MVANKYGSLRSGGEQLAPSTEIVRNFAEWQEKSAERPVYILHHGRPRSVLMSIDLYGRLLAEQGSQNAQEGQLRAQNDILLARMERMFAHADSELRIVRVNRAAADFLGESLRALAGRPLMALFPDADARTLSTAAHKVLETGLQKRLNLHGEPPLDVDIVPFPPGIGLFWADVANARALTTLTLERRGAEVLLSMMTGCAVGEIGGNGMLANIHPSLKRLIRFRGDMIARTAFADLFEEGSRRKCRLHLAHVLEGKGPVRCRIDLMTRDRNAVPVRLFLAPKVESDAITGAYFSVLDDSLGQLPMR